MTRPLLAVVLGATLAILARGDDPSLLPLPPDTKDVEYRHQTVRGKSGPTFAHWRIVAAWKTTKAAGPDDADAGDRRKRDAFAVTGPDDLVGVAITFENPQKGPLKANPDRFLAAVSEPHDPDGLTLRLDARPAADRGSGPNLGREALRVFWKPAAPSRPWLRLVMDPLPPPPADPKAPPSPPSAARYVVSDHTQPVPELPDVTAFVKLLDEIGRANTGRVFWLVEPGDDNPARVVVGWQPHGVAWWADGVTKVRCKLASPVWPAAFEVEAFEPPADGTSPAAAAKAFGRTAPARTGLVALPKGTWKILDRCGTPGVKPVALGREGVVLDTGSGYEIHVLRTDPSGNVAYDPKSVRTRGLAVDPPPRWTEPFNLKARWTVDEARHLVALSVCSPDMWRRPRGPGDAPAEHLRPLFMDPELWACPKAP